MVFSSIFFIFVFLPITLALYYIAPAKYRNVILLLMSLIFYAWGEPVYVILMVLNIIFNYIMGLDINLKLQKSKKGAAKRSLIFTVLVNLSLLGFFKYYGFVLSNINAIFGSDIPVRQLGLPIGISFYTFQVLSYIIDLYRGNIKVQKNIMLLGVYITMFPQLIAGPIVQYGDIEKQLAERRIDFSRFSEGVHIFVKGLAKKVLLANEAGEIFEKLSSGGLADMSVMTAWIIALTYTFQIYFDFSGYSDMAIGLGKMLGFDFKPNFDHPYISKSATEFWRRWHISLSSWFRDYVYIPLGGSYCSPKRHIFNTMTVWMLTGLWHGANWNFIIWGLYYGLIIIFEKYVLFKNENIRIPGLILHIYTMFVVMVGWVFFSITDMGRGLSIIKIMLGVGKHGFSDDTAMYYITTNIILWTIMAVASTPVLTKLENRAIKLFTGKSGLLISFAYIAMFIIACSYLVNDTYNPFLYFRF